MKITRSSKTSLKCATKKKQQILATIFQEYSCVVNKFIDYFWDHPEITSKTQLTASVYHCVESWFTARMKQCAAREALDMVRSVRNITTRKKSAVEREVEKLLGEPLPYESVKPIHYGKKVTLTAQVARIEEGRKSFDLWLILSSVGNGIKLSLPLKRHRHLNKFWHWKHASTIMITPEHVQLSFEMETGLKKETGQCVGIDVGINHLLATSDKELFGSEVKPLIEKIKQKTQGSKAYKRAKKTLSCYLHNVVKDYFATHALRLVVVEHLRDMKQGKRKNRSKEFRKTLSHWNYRELLDIIQLRCEEHRVSFRSVNPYKTSQRCPRCGHTQRENRNGEEFHCLQCGFEEQADIVGSMNILQRFLSGRYGAGFQTE